MCVPSEQKGVDKNWPITPSFCFQHNANGIFFSCFPCAAWALKMGDEKWQLVKANSCTLPPIWTFVQAGQENSMWLLSVCAQNCGNVSKGWEWCWAGKVAGKGGIFVPAQAVVVAHFSLYAIFLCFTLGYCKRKCLGWKYCWKYQSYNRPPH